MRSGEWAELNDPELIREDLCRAFPASRAEQMLRQAAEGLAREMRLWRVKTGLSRHGLGSVESIAPTLFDTLVRGLDDEELLLLTQRLFEGHGEILSPLRKF
jgi:hypothetical protein